MDPPRILIVEDDPALAKALADELGRTYDVSVVHGGRDALARVAERGFDLILLDLNLPDIDGLQVAEDLADDEAEIVMLTARGDVESRVRGLYAGAADYLAKPFDMHELLARVYARLRTRTRERAYRWGPLELAADEGVCRAHGNTVELTAQERALLELLLANQGRVYGKATLEERLYPEEPPASNAVEALVSRVRKKLAAAGVEGAIRTIRGLGYVVRDAGR
jgi:DNA-binding response OmpR family regulator